MEKTKKNPWWIVLKIFLIIIAILVVLFVAGYAVIRFAFGIDVFEALKKLKALGKPPVIERIIDYGIQDSDLDSGLIQLDNVGLSSMYKKENGKVSIDPTKIEELVTMSADLKLTDKQIGAIANTYLKTVIGSVAIDDEHVIDDIEIAQFKISDVSNLAGGYTSAKVNVVVKIGLKDLKDALNVFPLSLFVGYLPETLYINSTNTITMTSDMLYTVEYESLTVNNLTAADTTYLINLINKFIDVGSVQKLGETIGQYVGDVLIGSVDAKDGIAYALQPAGSKACHFEHDGTNGYFVITIATT